MVYYYYYYYFVFFFFLRDKCVDKCDAGYTANEQNRICVVYDCAAIPVNNKSECPSPCLTFFFFIYAYSFTIFSGYVQPGIDKCVAACVPPCLFIY
jgi:hypothetical protein